MPVYPAEGYYLCVIFGGNLHRDQVNEINDLLNNEGYGGYGQYEFQENNSVLIVNNIDDEPEGERLERKVKELILTL